MLVQIQGEKHLLFLVYPPLLKKTTTNMRKALLQNDAVMPLLCVSVHFPQGAGRVKAGHAGRIHLLGLSAGY